MRDLFIVGLILILYVYSIRNAYAACLTYWWFAIFRPQDWVYADISSFQLPFLATFIFFIVAFLRGYRPRIHDKISVLMILFYTLGAIAGFIYGCGAEFKIINSLEYLALLFIALFFTIDIVKTKQQLFGLVCVVSLSLAFYSGKGGLNYMMAGGAVNYGSNNLGGMFTGSNAYAMGTAILIFFMIFIFRQASFFRELILMPEFIKRRTYLIKVGMGLIIVGSVFTVMSLYSRGSAIAMFCGFFILYLLTGKKVKALFIIIPVVISFLVFVPIPEGYKERLSSAFVQKDELDASAASRPYFWKIAAQIVSDHPTGVGFNCYKKYYNDYGTQNDKFGWSRDVHSSHFNALSDSGYLGLLIWFSLFAVSLSRLFSLRRLLNKHKANLVDYPFYIQLCDAAIAAQIVYILGGSFYTLTYMDLIWWIWGITIILSKLINQEVKKAIAETAVQ
jgi:putative inorganic carbon (HCO3(-)) transporter